MFDRFTILGPKIPQSNINFLQQIQGIIKKNQGFFNVIEKWITLENIYLNKLTEIQSNIINQEAIHQDPITDRVNQIIQILIKNHKNLTKDLGLQIYSSNIEKSKNLIQSQKSIVQKERVLYKELAAKKQSFERVIKEKVKLKKKYDEQKTLRIFQENSYDTGVVNNMKRRVKLSQIGKEQNQYQIKVQQTKEIFDNIVQNSRQNISKFNEITEQVKSIKFESVNKIYDNYLKFSQDLSAQLQSKIMKLSYQQFSSSCLLVINKNILQEQQGFQRISCQNEGYLETCLRHISQNFVDEMMEYSKNSENKKKIKKIMQSDSIDYENTDQLTREIQLIKKILFSKEHGEYIEQFTNIITKSSKCRLNFIFVLQFNRLNNKFEVKEQMLRPTLVLIKQILEISHQQKDVFVLKQLMILLSTYYIMIPHEEKKVKIYILNFFKNQPLWKDIELWESILIESIYLEKKATIKMLLITSSTSNKSELVEAQKTSVLNQILYVVRNMLLFDFSEKEVKDFANKFLKLLKQNDRFSKDVHKTIENGIQEEKQTLLENSANQRVQKFLVDIFGPAQMTTQMIKVQSNIF